MLPYFFQGVLLGLAAAITPGPLQALFLAQTMESGWRRTIPAALAPLLSDGPIIVLVLLVLTQLPETFIRILQIIGGLFLIYLALSSFKQIREVSSAAPSQPALISKNIFKAALTNLLNPNPYIFWGTVSGPILLEALAKSTLHGLAFLLGFYLLLIGGFGVIISLFASGRQLAPQHVPKFLMLAAFILAFFGAYQLYAGVIGS